MNVKTLKVSELQDGIQVRLKTNGETVERYAEAIRENGGKWPFLTHIDVFQIDGQYRIADGHHRFAAAKQAGLQEVPCLIQKGTESDLLKTAIRGNSKHGLPMSKDDIKNARELVVLKYPEKSDRDLADICGCNPSTICRTKQDLEERGLLDRPETVIDSMGRKQATKKKMCCNATRPTQTEEPAHPETFAPEGFRKKCEEIRKATRAKISALQDAAFGPETDDETPEEKDADRKRYRKERDEFCAKCYDEIAATRKTEDGEFLICTWVYPGWSDTYHIIRQDNGEYVVRCRTVSRGIGTPYKTSEYIVTGGIENKTPEQFTGMDEQAAWLIPALKEYKRLNGLTERANTNHP